MGHARDQRVGDHRARDRTAVPRGPGGDARRVDRRHRDQVGHARPSAARRQRDRRAVRRPRRRAQRRRARARRLPLRRQQRRVPLERVQRDHDPGRHGDPLQRAAGLHGRLDRPRRPRRPASTRSCTASATAGSSAAPTTSSSTATAASGSPTSARPQPADRRQGLPALRARRRLVSRAASRSRCTAPTASASPPTATASTSPRASPAGCSAWDVTAPGKVAAPQPEVIDATKSHFDSLAVEESGKVVVAAINHGLCVVEPDGSGHEYVEMPDPLTTNVGLRRARPHAPRTSRCRGTGAWCRSTGRGPASRLAY